MATALTTFEEFETLPDPRGGHLELQHGHVIRIPPRNKIHMQIQQAVFDLLAPFLRDSGFLTMEFPFRPAAQYEAWQCDVGFVAKDRWAADHNEYFRGAPDLVIEVLSKSNTMDEILDRQDICLDNGCSSFWVIDPKRRTIMATTRQRMTITYHAAEGMPLPEPWKGAINVASIFPQ